MNHEITLILTEAPRGLIIVTLGRRCNAQTVRLSSCSPMFQGRAVVRTCDMPASRKVCGFTAHNPTHVCPKCSKEFKTGGVGQPTDYFGFEPCRGRNAVEHRQHVEEIQAQATQELRNAKESAYSARYSELL